MSSIIRVLDRRSGITYVYSSESYWDKEKKAPRNRRKLIGKVDPQTGDVVPTSGTRRRAMERNEEEARKRLREDIQGVDNDRSILSQKYRDALDQFDISLQNLEKDIQSKRKEIESTRRMLLES
jgi:hypothetical protein